MTFLCALLLVGAASMMTAGAQAKPTLAVFVVGSDNTLVTPLTTALGNNLTSSGRYTLTSVSISGKLTELQNTYAAGGGSSINRDALATWGREKGISAICLVVDDKKGNDHLFSAQLIDTKDSKLDGRGSYVRTNVAGGDATRVALALTKQLEGPGRVARGDAAQQQQKWFEPEMVLVEKGSFQMGCDDNNCSSDGREKPLHTVTLTKNFYMGKFEITRAQWLAVMAGHSTLANLGGFKGDDQLPIESVSYADITGADGFLERLNKLTGKSYRLPTEAEWEYAVRGGQHKSPYKYSGSDNASEVAWFGVGLTRVVGSKKPNALGIYDMCGNVWEVVADKHGAYSSAAQTDPTGPTTGNYYILRGGAYSSPVSTDCRLYVRSTSTGTPIDRRDNYIGFRVALTAQ